MNEKEREEKAIRLLDYITENDWQRKTRLFCYMTSLIETSKNEKSEGEHLSCWRFVMAIYHAPLHKDDLWLIAKWMDEKIRKWAE